MRNILMIDLETTGTLPGCRVLSIGAFGFDKNGNQVQYYKRLRVADQSVNGMKDEESTMSWWKKQPKKIYDEAWSGDEDTNLSIAEFKAFFYKNFSIARGENFTVWSKGSDFDFPILRHLFMVYGYKLPWEFWMQRDYRTLSTTHREIVFEERNEGKHSALEDAKAQMRGLLKFFEDHPNA